MAGIKVLLIDDDVDARRGLARRLKYDAGFAVDAYGGGSEALEALQASADEYTVVLTDLVLAPEMTGEELLKAIKSRYPRLPVIVFTGKNATGGMQTLAQGAYRYMQRPVDRLELISIIHNLAEQDALFREMAEDVRKIMGSDLCLAWRLDRSKHQLRVAGWDGEKDLDRDYRDSVTLDIDMPIPRTLFTRGKPRYFRDVRDPHALPEYQYRQEARERGWISLVSIPLMYQQRVIGLIDSYTYEVWEPSEDEKERLLGIILPAFAKQAARSIRNAQMDDQMQVLHGINQLLAGIFEEQAVIQQILSKGLELVGSEAGWIYLWDAEKELLVLEASEGLQEKKIAREREPGQGITGWVAENGMARNVTDVSKAQDHIEVPGLEIRSEVAVPLRREEDIIGVLTVKSRFLNAFSEDDVSLLKSLAAQAAIVIDRARLTGHLQSISSLALAEDQQALAEQVVHAARDLSGAEVILWRLPNEAQEEQQLVMWAKAGHFSKEYATHAKVPLDPKRSITALALEEGHPITRRNILEDSEKPSFYNIEEARRQGWHSFMTVPLLGENGKKLGSLSLYTTTEGKFGDADERLMQAFANQVAVALEYASSLQNERRLREQAETLRDVAAAVNAALDIERVGESILDELREIVEYRQATIQLIERLDLPRKRIAYRGIELDSEHDDEWALQPVTEDPLIQRVVEKGSPLTLPDVSADPDWTDREEVKGVRSWAGVPLIHRDEVIGLMTLDHDSVGTYTPRDEEILTLFGNQVAIAVGNSRLYDSLQQQVQRLKTLNQIGRDLGTKLDEAAIFNVVVRAVVRTLNCTHCTVFTLEGEILIPRSSLTRTHDAAITRQFSLGEGLAGTVAQTGTPVLANDATKLEAFSKGLRRPKVKRSMIVVPIKIGEQVVAVISADQDRIHAFENQDLELIETLALQASTALENARLFSELKRQQRAQVEAIEEISASITSSRERDVILKGILESTVTLMGKANLGEIRLIDEETGALVAVVQHGDKVDEEYRYIPMGEGITGYVALTGEPLLVLDVTQTQMLPEGVNYIPFLEGTGSELAVPMLKDGEVIGVLNIEHPEVAAFTEQHLHLAQAISRLAVSVLRNAELLEHIQQQKKAQVEAMRQISTSIVSSLEPNEVLEGILDATLSLMGKAALGEIRLVDKGSEELMVVASRGGYIREEHHHIPLGKGITGRVATSGQPLLVPDVLEETEYVPILDGVRSELAVPMIKGGQVIGVLNIEHPDPDAFTDEDLRLAQAIAGLSVVALENARLVQEIQAKRINEMRALNALVEQLSDFEKDL